MIRNLCHQFIEWSCLKNHSAFARVLDDLENNQLEILFRLTGTRDYENYRLTFPITNYNDWREIIEERRVKEKGSVQFIPTSGSTQKIKWIPYTKAFKAELWRATAPWLYDIYKRYPDIKKGTHFWSLSWLPEDMREDYQTNDLDFFVGLERIFLEQVMTLPASAATAATLEDSMKEALLSLLSKKVTLISIWSPTFLLELLDFLLKEKSYFLGHVDDETKKVLMNHSELSADFSKKLFPDLVLISSWATSTSKYYADQLRKLFPHAHFEAKGLWATEGVVTIPYKGQFPLAVNSHFYEFLVVDTKEVLPSWKLEVGMRVSPLLTTASGFFRYQLNDLLLVDGFLKKTPSFVFLGRINEVDLVGEKISAELAHDLLRAISHEFEVKTISLLAFVEPHAHYQLLIDGRGDPDLKAKIEKRLEEQFMQHFHYKLARELHQLSSCQVQFCERAMDEYLRYSEKQIAIRGNIKLEPLLLVRGHKL
ncbi:MAG: GH3 family domain-containing protein [Bacteriovorax sp.]